MPFKWAMPNLNFPPSFEQEWRITSFNVMSLFSSRYVILTNEDVWCHYLSFSNNVHLWSKVFILYGSILYHWVVIWSNTLQMLDFDYTSTLWPYSWYALLPYIIGLLMKAPLFWWCVLWSTIFTNLWKPRDLHR